MFCYAVFALLALARFGLAEHHRVLLENNRRPVFVEGDLGQIPLHRSRAPEHLRQAAWTVLGDILRNITSIPPETVPHHSKVYRDASGSSHIRFNQFINDIKVHGASIVMHIAANGSVYAVNGEMVDQADMRSAAPLDCDRAMAIALSQFHTRKGKWRSECKMANVVGYDGLVHQTWRRTWAYEPAEGGLRMKDTLFASCVNGELVAVHPRIFGALRIATQNCRGGCRTESSIAGTISSNDTAIERGHNYAVATYNFYRNRLGRDSWDDKGATIVSRIHYGSNYNNAYWNGKHLTYGDGNGVLFTALCEDADVVAHEFTHGVTQTSSKLIYNGESGALNEAMSDIFGAAVDRYTGASREDIWLVGEDIYTPSKSGDALRVLSDPARQGDSDYWPTRYTGSDDNGGVHTNSGIANLAFYLLVEGGKHPRGKTNVDVPKISAFFDKSLMTAIEIFYKANVACLTPQSNFEAARKCTEMHAGAYVSNVAAAWDAVGVPGSTTPLPPSTCQALDQACLIRSQCCSGMTCDGKALRSRKCVTCRSDGARCVRSTQCCSGSRCSGLNRCLRLR